MEKSILKMLVIFFNFNVRINKINMPFSKKKSTCNVDMTAVKTMKTDPPKLKLNTRMLRIDADELFSSAQYNIKPEIVTNLIMGMSRMEWSV